jgi:hypothetical protein
MEVHPEPDQRVGRPPDAAALTSVLVEAFETYREWAPENWSPDGNPGERESRLLPERWRRLVRAMLAWVLSLVPGR